MQKSVSLLPGKSREKSNKELSDQSQESIFALTSICFPWLLEQGICGYFPWIVVIHIGEKNSVSVYRYGGGRAVPCIFPSVPWCHFEGVEETGDGSWETGITRILGVWEELKGTS